LKHPKIDCKKSNALSLAAYNGHVKIVDRLLQDGRFIPSDYAFRGACYNGHIEVVDRWLQDPRVDPSSDDNSALLFAARSGHAAVVCILHIWRFRQDL
jgi:ankyrin repeat protein